MWEFAIRLLSAGGLIALSGWTARIPFESAWRISLITAAYAFVLYTIERRGKTNPGIAGLGAGLDALAMSAAIGYAGFLDSAGFFVLAPVIYAVAKRGSNPISTGPIAAAALMFADGFTSGRSYPTVAVLVQTAGVLFVALIANQPRVVVRPKTIRQMIAEIAPPASDESGAQALIELREKYRRLANSFKELERRSRIDRVRSHLFLAKTERGDTSPILEKLRTMLDAKGLILYTANQFGDKMIVNASAGDVPNEAQSLHFSISGREAAEQLKHKAYEAMRAISRADSEPISSCNVLLRTRGKVVGLLSAFANGSEKLEQVRERAEEAAEAVAQILQEDALQKRLYRRAAEAELLYEMACRLDGAATEADLGRRAARALSEILRADHVGIWLLDGESPVLAGKEGKPCRLFEEHNFSPVGLEGWIRAGAPPVLAFDVVSSNALNGAGALKQRFGSYVAVAIRQGDSIAGFITAASSTPGALGPKDAETMSDVAAELSNALAGARAPSPSGNGLVSIAEFQREVIENPAETSCLVYLEPLHFDQLAQTLGRPAIELAARQLGLLIRRNSPKDAGICRRQDGSFVALLPNHTLEQAQDWANEITVLASMRGYERNAGEPKIPLALKARAADLSQKPEKTASVSDEVA